jgi:calcineurin-like phosphoesterase family protein
LPNGDIPEKQTRPFETLDKMNASIVNNINEVVGQDDVLIHAGDFSFGGFDKIEEFRSRIICKEIHLVLGNHDTHIERNREDIQKLFTSVQNYLNLEYTNKTTHRFIICHYPICSWHDMKKGVFHLFGHLHTPKEGKYMTGRSMDVGMDGNDLMPYDIDDIVRKLSGRPISYNTLKSDHHLDDMQNVVG